MNVFSRAAVGMLVALLGLTGVSCAGDDRVADAVLNGEAAASFRTAYDAFEGEMQTALAVPAEQRTTTQVSAEAAQAVSGAFAELSAALEDIRVPSSLSDEKESALTAIRAAARTFRAQTNGDPGGRIVRLYATGAAYGNADQAIQALRSALGLGGPRPARPR